MKQAKIDSIDFAKCPNKLQKLVKLQKWLSNISNDTIDSVINKLYKSSFIDIKNFPILAHEILSVILIRPFSLEPLAILIQKLIQNTVEHPNLIKLPHFIIDELFSLQMYDSTPKYLCLLNFSRNLYQQNLINLECIHNFILQANPSSDVFSFIFILFYNELNTYYEDTFNKFKTYVKNKIPYRFIANSIETEIFLDYLKYGYSKSSIEYALKYDDLDALLSISATPDFNVNGVVKLSKFDNSSWLFPRQTHYIWFAAYYGSIRCFKYLALSGSKTKFVPVFAVCSGCLEIIHYCDQKGHSFKNMFYEAVKFRRNHIFDWLLNHEGLSRVQLRNLALSDGGSGNAVAFSGFLEGGLSTKTIDEDGSTLLHKVALNGDISIGSFLLKSHLMPNAQDSKGQTPLHLAVACGHLPFVRLLLENCKVDEVFDNYNKTALHIAAMGCDSRITDELVKHGFSPNAKRRKGTTPLVEAVKSSQLSNVIVLVEGGAKPNGKNKDAIKIARSNSQTHIVEYLTKHGF